MLERPAGRRALSGTMIKTKVANGWEPSLFKMQAECFRKTENQFLKNETQRFRGKHDFENQFLENATQRLRGYHDFEKPYLENGTQGSRELET